VRQQPSKVSGYRTQGPRDEAATTAEQIDFWTRREGRPVFELAELLGDLARRMIAV